MIMRQLFTQSIFIFVFSFLLNPGFSQVTFSDNFDAYNAGDFLCVVNPKWKTWDNKPGTATDTKIVNTRAASGNNSILISSTSTTGGPTDIILPFGDRYNTGLFTIEWKMYIEKGKTGYFNFQGNTTPGVLWTLNGFLRENNTLDLTGSTNARLFTTTYPSDEWFTFGMEINLTSNNWKVLINGECVGAFKNTNKLLAALNLYPTDASSAFYCDDFSFSYNPNAPEILNDLAVDNISWDNISFTGTEDNFSFSVSNLGLENILELELEATNNGAPVALNLAGVELASGETQTISTAAPITLNAGSNNLKVTVISVNGMAGDEEVCNNSTEFNLEGVTPAVNKGVLVEEATGTWCPWCPRGAVFLDLLSKKYNKRYIPIAVHNNDPMTVAAYDALIRSTPGFSGFPSVVLNRTTVTDPSTSEAPFLQRIAEAAPAYFTTGAKFNPDTRVLDVSVITTFQANNSKPMWINMVLAEDKVKGTGSGYNQANAYAGGGAGPMGGYELLPSPVPAAQMVYDHVGRFITGLTKNNENSVEGTFNEGESVTKSFSFTIPAGMNIDNFQIIPILLSADGYENAAITSYPEAVSNGYVNAENVIVHDAVKAYPNPAQEIVYVDFTVKSTSDVSIELMDITGSLVASKLVTGLQGDYTIPMSTVTLQPGMYLLNVRTQNETVTRKIFVTK